MADGEFELGNDGPSVILVGVDESVTASRAAWYAAGLARRQGARVVAVYVEPNAALVMTSAVGASVLAAENEAHGEIARIAQETRADAIIVGASLKAGHRLLGSIAVRLVKAGKWPVTVVP